MGAQDDAEALGIQGDDTLSDEISSDNALDTEDTQENDGELGGVEDATYPNPDKHNNSMHNIYERVGVHLPPKVKEEVDELFVDLQYEYNKEHDTEIEKNWDFFAAIFRVAVKNPELIRDEFGIEQTEDDEN